jgi:hypothetical protein
LLPLSPNSLQNRPASKVFVEISQFETQNQSLQLFPIFLSSQCEESKNLETNPAPASLPSDSFLVAKLF